MLVKIIGSCLAIITPLTAYLLACYSLSKDKYPTLPILPMLIFLTLSSIGAVAITVCSLDNIWRDKNDH